MGYAQDAGETLTLSGEQTLHWVLQELTLDGDWNVDSGQTLALPWTGCTQLAGLIHVGREMNENTTDVQA